MGLMPVNLGFEIVQDDLTGHYLDGATGSFGEPQPGRRPLSRVTPATNRLAGEGLSPTMRLVLG